MCKSIVDKVKVAYNAKGKDRVYKVKVIFARPLPCWDCLYTLELCFEFVWEGG